MAVKDLSVQRTPAERKSMIARRRQLGELRAGKHPHPFPLKYAVVGLGNIAQTAVLPAFAGAKKYAALASLVSDDPVKLRQLSKHYQVDRTYDYASFDECLESGIDAVYLALPNDMHCDYAVRAARSGVHVLCEKPMALSVADCRKMIQAAESTGVYLMIAYRLHFDAGNLRAIELANAGKLGDVRYFQSSFSMQVAKTGYRLDPTHGGGPLGDLGIYCINAARYLFRDEPTEVYAISGHQDDERFANIDEMVSVTLRFPGDRHAQFTASFGADATSNYQIVGTKGSLCVDSAYEENTSPCLSLTQHGRTREMPFKDHDQFAAELKYFSCCIMNRKKPEPSGEEGLRDLQVIEAIEQSIRTGRRIVLKPDTRPDAYPGMKQKIQIPIASQPKKLVHMHAASRD